MNTIYQSHSEEETKQIGLKIAETLKEGDILALFGQLGAGKTALVKGIAQQLKIEEDVTSPTFTIINEYSGKQTLYHMDLYRVEDEAELFQTGFEEYLGKEGIVVIEWPQISLPLLENYSYQKIEITIIDEYTREIKITTEESAK